MTKINWNRQKQVSVLNRDYFINPKTGFDKEWHDRQSHLKNLLETIDLGVHNTHEILPIKLDSGPHAGKLVCVTCKNKFLRWLPKGFNFN